MKREYRGEGQSGKAARQSGSVDLARFQIFTLSVQRLVMMGTVITSFRCPDTERLFNRFPVPRFQAISKSAPRRLSLLHVARSLADLAGIRGNRLESLKGDRKGQHSIRINDQWRICFRLVDPNAHDVEIVDYHH